MSDFLFAVPTFLSGMARALDLFGTLDDYNDMPTPDEADLMAFLMDLESVGADFDTAHKQFKRELESGALPRQERLFEMA